MCRMLGYAGFNVFPAEILMEFSSLAFSGAVLPDKKQGHPDGWGICANKNNITELYYVRSSLSLDKKDNDFINSINEIKKNSSHVVIAHIRKASCGNISIENTHPFIYNSWSFCHNGDIFDPGKIPLTSELPKSHTTDSERFFHFIMEQIKKEINISNIIKKIKEALFYIKDHFDYESLTFLLSNGKYIFTYRDFNKNSKQSSFNVLELENYYTLYKNQSKQTTIICSEPIDLKNFKVQSKWNPLQNNELLVVDDKGMVCFNENLF